MPRKWCLMRKILPALWVQGVLLILFTGAGPTPALAHAVVLFAYAQGDTIHTESTFVPDTPVRQGKILVLNQKTGELLLCGQTDDRGKFSFKIPAVAVAHKLNLEIVVEAPMGHRGEWLLRADKYLSGVTAEKAAAPAASAPASITTLPAPGTQAAALDRRMLAETVNKALERQLAPIKERLTALTIHRTTLPDIIGGLGYILGIFGLWAYFQSQRKKNP
jgi:nickel transport protein